jgi:hypothetical protein
VLVRHLTPGVSRCQRPKRSVGFWQSAAPPCWALALAPGCAVPPCRPPPTTTRRTTPPRLRSPRPPNLHAAHQCWVRRHTASGPSACRPLPTALCVPPDHTALYDQSPRPGPCRARPCCCTAAQAKVLGQPGSRGTPHGCRATVALRPTSPPAWGNGKPVPAVPPAVPRARPALGLPMLWETAQRATGTCMHGCRAVLHRVGLLALARHPPRGRKAFWLWACPRRFFPLRPWHPTH